MEEQKTVLFLGAAPTQVPAIEYALGAGHRAITLDNRPENPGHQLAEKYYNFSTTDVEAAVRVAREQQVDAVVSYASEPGALTAAHISEMLNIPGNPVNAVKTLTRKDLFRQFLGSHQFNVPRSRAFQSEREASLWIKEIKMPVFVKPVDSSGSKGVSRISEISQLPEAFNKAINFSRAGKVILEESVVRRGPQVAGDGFVVDGKLVFRCWGDEHFNSLGNGLVPIGQTFPSTHDQELLQLAHAETDRLLKLLGITMGALNFDFVFSEDNDLYFLEIGPRNGGCRIPEVIRYHCNVDLLKLTVDAALGLSPQSFTNGTPKGFWSSYVLHSDRSGAFKGVDLSPRANQFIVDGFELPAEGSLVAAYESSAGAVGTYILSYPDERTMLEMVGNMGEDIVIELV